MASLTKLIWSVFRRPSATGDSEARQQPAPPARRAGGPFTTGVPCNPEAGAGLLAAVAEPASSRICVASRNVHRGIYGIMEVANDLCCDGGGSSSINCTQEASTSSAHKSCRRCSRRLDGRVIYMYWDLAFCKPECRFDYFMMAQYDERHRELFGVPAGRSISADVKSLLMSKKEEDDFKGLFFRVR